MRFCLGRPVMFRVDGVRCDILLRCTLLRGVVTFLFTDVEGSTRRWEADAEGMRVALAAHDEVLRKAIEAHGGWLFKHTGDGMCAAFARRGRRWMPR